MTIDDDNSIYVGGLPYDATEDDLRRAFDLYGAVVAVKIVNDRGVGGKCYGFVTFTNPRSAVDAINDMNGRKIGGRVVRVNEVRTRGGRPNFHRDVGRDGDLERDNDHSGDRDRLRDRNNDRSRDRERDRDYDRGRDFGRARDHAFDRHRDRSAHGQEHARDHDRDLERDHDMDWDQDREMDKTKYHDSGNDEEQPSRNRLGSRLDDRQSRELSSNSVDEYQHQVKEELEASFQRSEELQKELQVINEKVDEREQSVSNLQKKCQKLEDALAAAKKLTSQRQSMLAKLSKSFLQTQEYSDRLKTSEQELKLLVDNAMAEVGMGEEAGIRDGSAYANGQV
ncbi:uncharacterized protein A4U43_C01F20860 [Asparagus officinalis]|uniref:RRM domain-containing protein n=1 Tax=Asparagus officinalis TaxID=4686 RepID=A0A5P1FTF5_ASPOF|nr:glycine-rich RNA-binding protein RZ1B isoform X1 [Asparagus officinalis]ONK80707.1 uncharacterized protein A4U43_C01F20860 [Asparagus officinalis]